jgi:membrane protease YdiL (CAAX protease family)
MSFLVWSLMKVVRGSAAFWIAMVTASLLFGLTHLRATAALVPLTPPAVARTVVLVAFAGVVFGWLYWRRGLEAAIAGHAATSLIAHLAVPALGF